MKTILNLIAKDLRRDWKQPWTILLFTSLPLLMTWLMALIFGGGGGSGPLPTIHVAVLDQDQDLFSGILRSLPTQGDAAGKVQLHFVDQPGEGIRMLESRRASAFLVLPPNMTSDLLNGRTNSIQLYENPAEQILPLVVRQGAELVALGLSSAAEVLGTPIQEMRTLFQSDEFPAEAAVASVAAASTGKLRSLRTYLFPPLVQIETVRAADFSFSTNISSPPDG